MAQHDINIEAGIIPVLDQRGADALVRRVQKLQKQITSGVSSKASEELSALSKQFIASQVMLGKATTTTSGRIMLEKRAGVTGSFAKAFIRQGADEAKIALKEGRVSAYPLLSGSAITRLGKNGKEIATSYNEAVQKYAEFQQTPTKESKEELLSLLSGISNSLQKIQREGKPLNKTLVKIDKNTNKMVSDTTSMKVAAGRQARAVGVGSMLGSMSGTFTKLLGIGSIAALIQKIISFGFSGMKAGEEAITQKAMYGANRNVALTKQIADMYGVSEKTVATPHQYALMFNRRMNLGQVSDQEWFAIDQLGDVGRMITSGYAAKNPKEFQIALTKYIKRNRGNEAEVFSNLQMLGWDPEMMKYAEIEYKPGWERMIAAAYESAVEKETKAARKRIGGRAVWNAMKEEGRAKTAEIMADMFYPTGVLEGQEDIFKPGFEYAKYNSPYSIIPYMEKISKMAEEKLNTNPTQITYNQDIKIEINNQDVEGTKQGVLDVFKNLNRRVDQ